MCRRGLLLSCVVAVLAPAAFASSASAQAAACPPPAPHAMRRRSGPRSSCSSSPRRPCSGTTRSTGPRRVCELAGARGDRGRRHRGLGQLHRRAARRIRRRRLPLDHRRRPERRRSRPRSRPTSRAGGGFAGIHAASDTEYDWPWYGASSAPTSSRHPAEPERDRQGLRPRPPLDGRPAAALAAIRRVVLFRPTRAGRSTCSRRSTRRATRRAPARWAPTTRRPGATHYDGGRSWYTGGGHTDRVVRRARVPAAHPGRDQVGGGPGRGRMRRHVWSSFERSRSPRARPRPVSRSGSPCSPIAACCTPLATAPSATRTPTATPRSPPRSRSTATTRTASRRSRSTRRSRQQLGLHLLLAAARHAGRRRAHHRHGRAVRAVQTAKLPVPLQVGPAARGARPHERADPARGRPEPRNLLPQRRRLRLGRGRQPLPLDRRRHDPFESDGYTPIDERPNRNPAFDAQRSAANTNDLRGKILRIKPDPTEADYTIPAGNLFAPGEADTRPEIYAMGFRNPFRISVDKATGYLYVGDYGPDAGGAEPARGPRRPGRVQRRCARRATTAGHTAPATTTPTSTTTSRPGPPARLQLRRAVNDVAPATPASRAAAGDRSRTSGTATAVRGRPRCSPAARSRRWAARSITTMPANPSETKFPEHFDDHWFPYEWGRGWIKETALDPLGGPLEVSASSTTPSSTWSQPMDMEFGPDGALYVLDYGTGFFGGDARLGALPRRLREGGRRRYRRRRRGQDLDQRRGPADGAVLERRLARPRRRRDQYAWDFGDGATV